MCFRTKVSLLLLALFVGAGVFSMNVQPAEAASLAELQLIIQDLKVKIAELQAKLKAVQAQQQEQEWCHNFNKNLRIGDKGAEVKALRTALTKQGFSGLEAMGGAYEFDERVASAVVGFQEKYKKEVLAQWGLKHGTGFVGKSTRAKLNKLYGCGITPIYTPKCQETDNMQDYYTKGVVTFSGNKSVDYCVDNNTLKEYWCTGMGGVEWVHNIDYTCPNGCVDGACKRDGEYRPSITVTSPNDGEQWVIGNTYPIKWNSTGYTSKKEITISLIKKDVSELVYDELIAVSSNTGYYNWRVGTISTGVTIEPGEYKIRIVTGEIEGGGGGVVVDRSDYFSIVKEETGANLPPVIGGITAPTQLRVNEKGVWTVKARDPENGSLSYSVNWGDKYANIALPESAPAEIDTRTQTTTFTHSYSKAGTYTIRFTVTDDHKQTAKTSTTIKIGGSEIVCTDSDGGENKYVRGRTCRDLYNLKEDYDSSDPTTKAAGYGRFCRTDKCVYNPIPSIEKDSSGSVIWPQSVIEYYCSNNRIFSKTLYCENGCANGACKRDEVAKSIKVLSPNGGEQWVVGETYNITWNSNNVDTVMIQLDKGNPFEDGNIGWHIAYSVPASQGSYSWTLEDFAAGDDYKIEIWDISDTSVKDFSNDYFSIVAATTCSSLQNQTSCLDNSGCYWDQQYDNCRTYNSTKQTCSDPDNGKDIYTQAHTYGFRQTYADERDKRIRTGGKDACIGDKLREHYCVNDYYIRTYDVECPNGCVDGACKPGITVTSPNGGETWQFGETREITWTSNRIDGNVYLFLSDGESWMCEIGEALANDGEYSVKVDKNTMCPNSIDEIPEGLWHIIVSDNISTRAGLSDRSDDYFTIGWNEYQNAGYGYHYLIKYPGYLDVIEKEEDQYVEIGGALVDFSIRVKPAVITENATPLQMLKLQVELQLLEMTLDDNISMDDLQVVWEDITFLGLEAMRLTYKAPAGSEAMVYNTYFVRNNKSFILSSGNAGNQSQYYDMLSTFKFLE